MQVTLGKKGLVKSYQKRFTPETNCVHCSGKARIGFVAHEFDERSAGESDYVCGLHKNKPQKNSYWLHDACAVAVYFCKKCLDTTAIYNQA